MNAVPPPSSVRRRSSALFAAMLTAMAAPGATGQAVDLTPRFEPGQADVYTLTQKSENRVASPGTAKTNPAPADQTLEQSYTLRLSVDEALPEGGARLSLVYERVRVKLVTPDRTIEVDSDKPANAADADPITLALTSIAGTTLRLTADAKGTIKKVEGGADTLGLSSLLGQAGSALSGKDAVSVLMPGTAPPTKARVGDTWTSTSRLAGPLLGDTALTLRHSLESVCAGVATVAIKGSMEPAKAKGAQDSIARVSSATTDGTYLWNTQRGGLDSLTLRQVVRLESDLIEPGRVMESTSVTEVRREPPEPKDRGGAEPGTRSPEKPRNPR